MHPRERVIRDRFAGLACAHCGTLYAPAAIVVLARRRTKWMVLACCHTCERQAIFVVTFPPSQVSQSAQPQESPLDSSSYAEILRSPHSDDHSDVAPHHSLPVSVRDVDAMHEFLAHFDGNFQSLFSHTRRHLSDESSS